MDNRDVVVTGIGVVMPGVRGTQVLWDLQSGAAEGCPAGRSSELSPRIRGTKIEDEEIAGALPARLSKKLDAFTRYALVATQDALADSGLDLEALDMDRAGAFVGNCFGGWRFTEVELRRLHQIGPRAVSPFQATSWFPAAPQGQITILNGFKGCSKTYMADRMSSLVSIAAGASQIRRGLLDVAVAGGAESTNTDFVRAALETLAAINGERDPATSGFEISEGAVFLVLEEREHARARGARIYARLGAFASRSAPCAPDRYATDPATLTGTMSKVLGNRRADIVLPDASGLAELDACESAALDAVCPSALALRPKRAFGHSFGAEGALDIAYASLMLERQETLGTTDHPAARPASIERILVNSCAMGGGAGSFLIEKEI